MTRVIFAATALWLVCAGCHAHVTLEAPPPQAAPEARAKAYSALRPLSYHETHTTTYQGGVPIGARRTTDYLQLASGTRVYYPEDLLAVLPPGFPSAVAAQESAASRELANILDVAAIVAFVAGTAIVSVPPLVGDVSFMENRTPFYAGMGVMTAGAIVFMISWFAVHPSTEDAAATAFETYDAGLRDKLGVCHEDGRDIICRDPREQQMPSQPGQPSIVRQGACINDMDCGANRLCDQGVCADPTPVALPVVQPVGAPPAQPRLQQGCDLCPTRCASHKTQCNAGTVSACYQLGACVCQCQLDFGGCGRSLADLKACVAKNTSMITP